VKAISVLNPWAVLLAIGAKTPEAAAAPRDLSMTAEQQELFDAHRVWALKIANRGAQRSQLRPEEAEPLKNAALVGLIQAAQRFDPERGLAFKTMAGLRIAGAVTDCLRGESWVPRGMYKKTDQNECWEQLRKTGLRKISLNFQPDQDGDRRQLQDCIRLPDKSLTLDATDEVEWMLAGLRPMEQFVLRQHYLHDEPMKAIGDALDLSESRVSQICKAALENLRRVNGVTNAESGSGSRG